MQGPRSPEAGAPWCKERLTRLGALNTAGEVVASGPKLRIAVQPMKNEPHATAPERIGTVVRLEDDRLIISNDGKKEEIFFWEIDSIKEA